jgi:hypothetical protein
MNAVSPRAEVAMHASCCALAFVAFAVFYALCININAGGYNARVEGEQYTPNAFNHLSTNDDLDDAEPSNSASVRFRSAREDYDNLVRNMMVAWDVVVGVAMGMWIALRALHEHALRALRSEVAATTEEEARDEWLGTRRSFWGARRLLLEAQREAFNEVAKPLEPYIAPSRTSPYLFCFLHRHLSCRRDFARITLGQAPQALQTSWRAKALRPTFRTARVTFGASLCLPFAHSELSLCTLRRASAAPSC